MATIAVHDHDTAVRSTRSTLETVMLALLGVITVIWTVFQIVEIKTLFPPIGILYAAGSIILIGLLVRVCKPWMPAVVAAWAVLTMIPESLPAIEHLLDWSELYTHFGHYLIIMTFFPLAFLLVAVGIATTVQNRASAVTDAPSWLRPAVTGVVALIVTANIVTIVLYALEIP
jgi:hypothetical protein